MKLFRRHVNTSMMVADPVPRRRRLHSAEFNALVIAACAQPGISIVAVALSSGLNAKPGGAAACDVRQAL